MEKSTLLRREVHLGSEVTTWPGWLRRSSLSFTRQSPASGALGVLNASQTGNVYAQQITVQELADLRTALAEVRTVLKAESQSLETDEHVGLLAMAERAASDKDESKMLDYLKQIPSKAWDVGKVVVPQVLLHYLRLHNLV